jgi:succinoglycan biosynthesis transport protein ExoP
MDPKPAESYEPDPVEERHLRDYVEALLRRRYIVLAVFLAVLGIAAFRTFLERPVYEASVRLLVQPEIPRLMTFGDGNGSPDAFTQIQTHYQLLQSRSLARSVIEDMELLNQPDFGGPVDAEELKRARSSAPGESARLEAAIDSLVGRLRVEPVGDSQVVSVAFQSGDRLLSARVPNRLAQLYIQQSIEQRFEKTGQTAAWLREQITSQRRKAEEANREISDIGERQGIADVEERRRLIEEKLKDLGSALTLLRRESLEKQALYEHMAQLAAPEDLPELRDDENVRALRLELGKLEADRTRLSQTFGEKHPQILAIDEQILGAQARLATERKKLVDAAREVSEIAAAREKSMAAELDAAKAESLLLSRRTTRYDSLRQELQASRDVLDRLVARSSQTDVTSQIRTSNVQIVDPAVVPNTRLRPNHRKALTTGALFAAMLAIAFGLFLDYLDSTLRTADDVSTHLKTPLLGVITESRAGDGGPDSPAQSAIAEGYRMLRTALGFSWGEREHRLLIVTSAIPREGKTTTTVNLALTLAATEARVLLVDCDLRRPRAHEAIAARVAGRDGRWAPLAMPGVADVLVGGVSLDEATQHVPGTSLSFLAAGTSVPSPADFLTARAVRAFLEGLRERYDWVVIDTPPVNAVTDAVILAPLSDGVVVVVGAEMAHRSAIRHTVARLTEAGARVLGVVLNRARVQPGSYAHYDSHYYRETAPIAGIDRTPTGSARLPS